MPRVFLIDTDTGADDAVALIMALRARDVRVAAITTVAGNVSVQQATRNALYTTEVCDAPVPVFVGAQGPLLRVCQGAQSFHGKDGLGDRGYPPPGRAPESSGAVEALIGTIEANPGLVLVTLGPLTNLALALTLKPSIASKVGRCVIMGGAACCEGNVTPAAEYNIWVDPEAARIVFRSGLPLELVGWNLSRNEAVLSREDIDLIFSFGRLGRFVIECNTRVREAYSAQSGKDGIPLADPVAMSIAIEKSIGVSWGEHYADVETNSELTRGMTVVDRLNVASNSYSRAAWSGLLDKPPNVKVCWAIDSKRWKEALYSSLQ